MKKKILVLRKILVILVILQFAIFASAARHRVYLLHPTVGNIENMMELLQQKVIEIPDLEMVGVQYHPEKSSRYLPDALYVSTPAEKFSLNKQLVKEKSIDFHLKFWKDFSTKVAAIK